MKNNLIKFYVFIIISSIIICAYSFVEETDKKIEKGRYELITNWPNLPKDYILGQVTGIGVDTNENIFLFHRASRMWTYPFPDSTISDATVLQLDSKTGKIINSWGKKHFIMPHGLTVDKENNVWVTDVALHQIFKFTHDGKLLLKVGEQGISGNDSLHFNMPTDIAVCKDGSFYVSDGYGNSRIVKFSNTGKYLFAWGKKGVEQSEFNTPHGIDIDSKENVYVADRENNRIQKFDRFGNFLLEWKNPEAKQLYSLTIEKSSNGLIAIDYLTIADTIIKGSDILLFDSNCKFDKRFGRSREYHGDVCRYHDVAIDKNENIYVGDILRNKIQKFSKIQ